ncbi:Histidine phosphatase superfamily, clade-2 [Cordyceps fumosorosea ARSEF 2679]|uniref:Histidine phosphatase superfamily, clade-2 n=1 Tax=Cordyceps fumosorosea (strain ARSEF 2679) TaxID=1081104 RepID=A0A168BLF5_CORFA|nr:Histidine phosphatase superfamily, clade-2 [Cordyceps fumosorosea ARSEF 2679]OAA70268.1 Histidine phosphatase superfamily, clade-2 [Cordyceps fumosorosea ARSEF 2679]
MRATVFSMALMVAAGSNASAHVLTDAKSASSSWGELSSYADNREDAFGVGYVGLPDGCQVESVSTLQRHAERFPDSVDNVTTGGFAQKLADYKRGNKGKHFTGPLKFLNSYQYILNNTGLLTGIGANTEFGRGVAFWNNYGRTLFDAQTAQLQYSAVFGGNGTERPKVTLRTTSQSRIENSQINWALGFFGPSFNATPEPDLLHWTAPFSTVIIPEGGTENNTLASYDGCTNSDTKANNDLAAFHQERYIKIYARAAAERLASHAPAGFSFTAEDVYAMQMTCAYEYGYVGQSDFCQLFTAAEWAGFETVLDQQYYYLYAYGNPTGRAQGVGYVQELLARLEHQYISVGNSSVNATFDDNGKTFPLGQKVYADFSHDDIIISALTALSVDYFKSAPTLDEFPPATGAHFTLSHLTPFGANLVTEQIGCAAPDPAPVENRRVAYTAGQYGYEAKNATHKFIRMRLNNGIIPLNTIRGGKCGDATSGRLDGLCELGAFLESQANTFQESNYQYACFGNYTLKNSTKNVDYDGTIFAGKTYN